jgi:type II secretory pathway component PulK
MRTRRRGGALIFALVTLLVVMLMTGTLVRALMMEVRRSRQAVTELQSQWLAESAIERATARLRADPQYQGEIWKPEITDAQGDAAAAVAEVQVEKLADDPQRARISINARYPDHPWRRVAVQRSYILPRSEKQSPGDAREENMP